jgi:hypothetical protein
MQAKAARGGKRSRTSGGTMATRVVERKEAERKRRQHMKALCAKLTSLIPKEHFSNPVRPQTILHMLYNLLPFQQNNGTLIVSCFSGPEKGTR